jgi:hypothetical protein
MGGGGTAAGAGGQAMGSAGAGNTETGGSGAGTGGINGNGGSDTGGSGTGGDGSGADACAEGTPGAYFVDSTAGDDSATGDSPATAWQTLDRVNAEVFEPGDAICFRSGSSFEGQFAPQGNGSSEAPIVVNRYGEGDKPLIAAGAGDLQAVLLENVQYWEINELEITNDQGGPGDYRGIAVRGRDAGMLSHIYIRNSFIHDVTGQVNWIGGDVANNDPPWVTFQTGWDASKRTGGIVVEVASENGTETWFDDIVIENNVIQDTSFGGIIFKQLEGSYGWGVRSSANDADFLPHTNIVIRGNFLSQTNTPYGCNTIYVTGAQHVLIERNVTQDSGTSAIEAYNSDDVVIQHNETYGTVQKAGGADSNGIDADRATTNTIIQYNYVHDNGDGILLCQFVFGTSIVRYNVLVNNRRHGINLHSDEAAVNETYNNLIFIDGLNSGNLIATSGNGEHLEASYTLSNNLFHSTRAAASVTTGPGVVYSNNLFSGIAAVGSQPQTGDPLFIDDSLWPSGGASGPALEELAGLQWMTGSPAQDNGTPIEDNGGQDFWGNPLYQGAADIGPFEAP